MSEFPDFLKNDDAAWAWALENVDLSFNDRIPYQGDYERREAQLRAEEYAWFARDALKRGSITIYRMVCVEGPAVIQTHNLGKAWSKEREAAGCYGGHAPEKGRPILIEAIVSPRDVDWAYGFTSFMYYGESQWEVSLDANAPVIVTVIDGKKYDPPVEGNTGHAKEQWEHLSREGRRSRASMNPIMSPLEAKAAAFAKAAHERVGQKRKYTGDPYIVHPGAVADIVRSVPHDEEMLAAAWLHDTVEDTGVSPDEIRAQFGNDVADLVGWLTDVSTPADGNRKVRKEIDRQHTAKAPPRAHTVKLADLINNSESILAHDPKFARLYLEEKRLLLDVLRDGDPTLWARANEIVRVGQLQLGANEASAPIARARPIALDKTRIDQATRYVLFTLAVELERRHPQDEPLGTLQQPQYVMRVGVLALEGMKTVRGRTIQAPVVIVTSYVSDAGEIVLSGGAGVLPSGRHVILVNINGRYNVFGLAKRARSGSISPTLVPKNDPQNTYDKFKAENQASRMFEDLRKVLLHEMTHILDVEHEMPPGETSRMVPLDLDRVEYYNRSHEVRAYLAEVVDQVLTVAPKLTDVSGGALLKDALSLSDTWRELDVYWTEENRKLVLRAVYRALDDAGYIDEDAPRKQHKSVAAEPAAARASRRDIPPEIQAILPDLVRVAQREYDEWQQDAEGYDESVGSGGICHLIADKMVGVLSDKNIMCTTVSSDHEVHVYVVAKLESGVWEVDIRPHVYERGGGYTWKKIPDVTFEEADILVNRLSPFPEDFVEMGGYEED